MGPKEFQIVLDRPVYYGGQNLTGKLVVELKEPMKIKGLYIRYSGKGIIHWIEGWGSTLMTYGNSETYLMEYQLVFGNEVEESELARGKHVFNFNCELPPDLPCSYDQFLGCITYSVKVLKNCPLKRDYLARQSVKIASVFDLNTCPYAPIPIEKQSSKIFWRQSKPLCISVNLPFRGFTPGQVIPIRVTLDNKSEVRVKSIVATLMQEVIFHATDKSNPVNEFLSRNEFPVDKGIGFEEVQLSVKVPASLQSHLQFCQIIDIRYQLDIKAKVSGCHRSLKIPIEVIIGDVPLRSYEAPISDQQLPRDFPLIPEFESPYNNASSCGPPLYDINVLPSPPKYEAIPPPSYEESEILGSIERLTMRGGERTEDDSGNCGEEKKFSELHTVFEGSQTVNNC